MTVRDYVSLWATETHFGHSRLPARASEWLSGMVPTLAMPLQAVRDAPLAPGRFPVVIYAPGCSNPSWDNADLCEYLASHGYVVIAGPSLGAESREMTMDLTGASTQARDISFLEVIEAVEGPVQLNVCLDHKDRCDVSSGCTMYQVWKVGQDRMLEVYRRTSLAELASEPQVEPIALGIPARR